MSQDFLDIFGNESTYLPYDRKKKKDFLAVREDHLGPMPPQFNPTTDAPERAPIIQEQIRQWHEHEQWHAEQDSREARGLDRETWSVITPETRQAQLEAAENREAKAEEHYSEREKQYLEFQAYIDELFAERQQIQGEIDALKKKRDEKIDESVRLQEEIRASGGQIPILTDIEQGVDWAKDSMDRAKSDLDKAKSVQSAEFGDTTGKTWDTLVAEKVAELGGIYRIRDGRSGGTSIQVSEVDAVQHAADIEASIDHNINMSKIAVTNAEKALQMHDDLVKDWDDKILQARREYNNISNARNKDYRLRVIDDEIKVAAETAPRYGDRMITFNGQDMTLKQAYDMVMVEIESAGTVTTYDDLPLYKEFMVMTSRGDFT